MSDEIEAELPANYQPGPDLKQAPAPVAEAAETSEGLSIDGRLSADTLTNAANVLDAFVRTSEDDEWTPAVIKVRDALYHAALLAALGADDD